MKVTLSRHEFVRMFDTYNRSNNFSVEAREALFDYFEEIDADMELDVIAVCCEYSEYESLEEFQKDYSEDYESIEDIEKDTQVIRLSGDGFVIQQF